MHYHIYNLFSVMLPARPFMLRRWLLRRCGMKVGHDVKISANVRVYDRFLSIGDGTWVGPDCSVHSNRAGPVEIGCNCDVGPGVAFITGSHDIGAPARRAGRGFCRPISVGDGCWIGARALILGGAVVGRGSVVGAGSLVLPGSYPANSVLVGTPAKVRRLLED